MRIFDNEPREGRVSDDPLLDDNLKSKFHLHKVPMTGSPATPSPGWASPPKKQAAARTSRARPGLLALRPRPQADRRLDQRQVQEEQVDRRGQPAGPARRLQLRLLDRILHEALHRPAPSYARQVSQDHRQRSDRLGLVTGAKRCGKRLFMPAIRSRPPATSCTNSRR